MSDIETRLFRYFVAVAEEQHFARAAERLGISGPTLTNQIQKLESQLGARLLRRKGNTKVVLTEAGKRFLPRAREGLRQLEEAAVVARQAGRGELGRLKLGFVASVYSSGLLEKWIGPFKEVNPAIEVGINHLSPMAQVAGIIRGDLDAGFARTPDKYPAGVRGFDIYRQPLVLALPSKHPLARHKEISPAMLEGESFVSFPTEPDLGFTGYTEAIASLGNFVPRVVMCNDDFATVLACVGLGHGIAVAAELLMKTTNAPNVVFRKIAADPAPQTSVAFIYCSSPSPSGDLLIRHMRRHALRTGGDGAGAVPRHNRDRLMIPPAHRHPAMVTGMPL
jgi:DNA-binding transcriptional LysR family regulator